jgi:Cof subfamily protein (haloacid dehalogenase superfamily)
MMMKLIALDLDGTALNSRKEMTEVTISAIKSAQQQGHIVMALSGRPADSINMELAKYGLDLPVGGNNGTELFANGKVVEITALNLSQSQRIVMELEKESMPYKISTDKRSYAHKDWLQRFDDVVASGRVPNEHFEHKDFKMFTTPPHVYGQPLFDRPEDVVNENSSVIKFLILGLDPEQRERVQAKLESIEETYVTSSSPFNLEVTHMNGNKGNGLKSMARYFNIPLEDTVAIGDEKNDIPMFNVAGLSIAMENAEEEVKKHADIVTLTNDENGVAYAIDKYILKASYVK